MYGKEEAKLLKKEFWTSFGLYMKKHNTTYGRKLNWVNYKTKVKDLYFRLNADNKKVTFAIELQHEDHGVRDLFYDQFLELKTVITDTFEHDLRWERNELSDYGILIARIGCELTGVSVFNKDTWAKAFKFMETNITNTHEFWEDFHDVFEQLEQ